MAPATTMIAPGKISLALGGAKKPSSHKRPPPAAASASTNGVKRPHAALHDHDDDESTYLGHSEVVSHFDRAAGGAIDAARPVKEEKPLVIAPRKNRDWREASQRNKRARAEKGFHGGEGGNGRRVENGEASAAAVAAREAAVEAAKPVYGLNVMRREEENGHAASDGEADPEEEQNGDVVMKDKTDDERAIDALLGKEQKSNLVLPVMTEEEAFARDFRDAPDMATLEDYERVPVEQFGAALLRGMGWKDGEGIGSQRGKKVERTKVPERRPALLGIGAKEEAAVAQELGTWGRAAKDRKGPQQVYNPVLLRDKKTGELYTEEELEKKRQRDEKERYEMEFEQEERRKEKEKRRDGRHRDDERRDRRGEESGDRDGRKRDDDAYRRRKEKERRRRERSRERDHERRDKDHDHERHRDRKHDHRR